MKAILGGFGSIGAQCPFTPMRRRFVVGSISAMGSTSHCGTTERVRE